MEIGKLILDKNVTMVIPLMETAVALFVDYKVVEMG